MKKFTWGSVVLVLGIFLTGCGGVHSVTEDADHEEVTEAEEVNLGYGTQPQSKMTNAVAFASKRDIERYHAQSMRDLLAKLPGFSMRGSRGYSLILLDGAEIPGRDLAVIHPSEVASISLLKDAGSKAIYGFRGVYNPILVITTDRVFN